MAPWLHRRFMILVSLFFILSLLAPGRGIVAQEDPGAVGTPAATEPASSPPDAGPPQEAGPMPTEAPGIPIGTAAPTGNAGVPAAGPQEAPLDDGTEPGIDGFVLTVTVFDGNTFEPIAGASVEVTDIDGMPVATGVSGEGGVFSAEPLAGGEYTVAVAAGGYMPRSVPVWLSESTSVEVGLDPALQSGTLAVHVIDQVTGLAIAGASVTVYDDWNGVVGSGTTDGSGAFVTGELAGGYYGVDVSAPGYRAVSDWILVSGATAYTFELEGLPQPGVLTVSVVDAITGDPISGATVSVTWPVYQSGVTNEGGVYVTGELVGGNYWVDALASGYFPASQFQLVNGATSLTIPLQPIQQGHITVQVVSRANDEPVAGATVSIFEYQGHVSVTSGPTSDDGTFVSDLLTGGEYAIEVSADGYYAGYTYPFVNGDITVPIALDPLPLPGVLTVTVVDGGSGAPLAGITVTVRDPWGGTEVSGLTDEYGQIVTPELPSAYYHVEVLLQGYDTGLASIQVNGATSVTVTLRPLAPGTLTVHVSGRYDGNPLAGVTVVVRDGYSDAEMATGTSGEGGLAVIDLPGGFYRVVATADGYFAAEGVVQVNGGGDIYLALEPRVAGVVTVTVQDETTWELITGATVVFVEPEGGVEVARGVTGADGAFVTGEIQGGFYDVSVLADGYVPEATRILVSGPSTFWLSLAPEPGILSVSVIDEVSGQPVANATVTVSNSLWEEVASGVTDGDGVFHTQELSGGIYTAVVTASGYFDGSGSVAVQGDTDLEIALEPRLPGTLTVTVVDEITGQPIRRATVSVRDTVDGTEVAAGETGKAGRFTTGILEAGYYEVTAIAADHEMAWSYPLVNGPTQTTIGLWPRLPGRVTVQVVDSVTGEPVAKANVAVHNEYWTNYDTGTTNKSGEFRTGKLPGGGYYVDVTAPGYFLGATWAGIDGDIEELVVLYPRIPGALTLTVVDGSTALPLAGATVRVNDVNGIEVATGTTDSSGVFVSPVLAAGPVVVEVTAEGYMPSGDMYTQVDGDTSLGVALEPAFAGTLTVDVMAYDTYLHLAGATVVVRELSSGVEVAREVTDDLGLAVTPELPAGDYTVRVSADGYAAATTIVTVNGPSMTTMMLEPREAPMPGALTVRFLSSPSGAPIVGASIVVIDPDDLSEVATGTTDATGAFVTGELPGGDYLVRMETDFYYQTDATVEVDGPVELTWVTEIRSTATIRVIPTSIESGGRVTVEGEGFAPGETVRVTWDVPGGVVLAQVKADKNGMFSRKVSIPDGPGGVSSVVAVGLESGAVGAWFVIVTAP